MNQKGKIRLTESLLRNVIRESINRILNESDNYKEQTNGWWGTDPNYTRKSGKVSESQLHNIVKESINKVIQEVAGYQSTMQKANNQFN